MTPPCTRRQFVGACAATAAALVAPRGAAAQRWPQPSDHPTPRPGITAAKVLPAERLAGSPSLARLFDGVREIPEIVDGIRCHCGCAALPGYYSLLSCFEGEAMARACPICQGQARLTIRLHKEGKSLDEVRAAVDAQFG